MATKRFIIEVEEGVTNDCNTCLFGCSSRLCLINRNPDGLLSCDKYNLATMEIKELEEK